ncbi:hypothetical protein FBR06_08195 [Betaproteobacteria bacterium PRO4]|uniref:hypothetical protein n=1 Tax=Nitrosomonas sp. TaxID=42353 RepID=UPI0025633B3B|nr:hypothetical protein [Nitrosomonas sp.]MBE7527394.1 hypothetical protein [Burkholderiales bacterium]MDL1867203.1 hypothetical protein [Betaproteobacteria bacterium PRO4]
MTGFDFARKANLLACTATGKIVLSFLTILHYRLAFFGVKENVPPHPVFRIFTEPLKNVNAAQSVQGGNRQKSEIHT